MAENPSTQFPHPTISPDHFDLIIYGTGLPESIIAAASSAAGKSVLHIDHNSFYGSQFSSLPLPSLSSFLQSQSSPHKSYNSFNLQSRSLFSDLDITDSSIGDHSERFFVDLCGPRVLYCADAAVDLMLRSGASHHVEFKSVEKSLIYWEGRFSSVPDSRQAIFRDGNLSRAEKGQMMRFLKLVREFEAGEEVGVGISDEDLEISFADFLCKQKLPVKIRT